MARADWDQGIISRKNAEALMPPVIFREIVKGVRKQSVFFNLAKRLPNMTSDQASRPVLAMLPQAGFVNGDTGLKAVTEMAWARKSIYVGELACIVPIPINVLDDAAYPIWEEVYPAVTEAMAREVDLATLARRDPNAPAQWPDALIPGTIAQGNTVTVGTGGDIFEDISNAMALLEEDEYDVNGVFARRSLKTDFRNFRTANGLPLFQDFQSGNTGNPYGVPTYYGGAGIWNAAAGNPVALLGDWSQVAYAIRRDMTFQIFDTGVITNDQNEIVYNLMQQDMVALRVFMRFGWQLSNAIDIDRDPDNFDPTADHYAFSVLQNP